MEPPEWTVDLTWATRPPESSCTCSIPHRARVTWTSWPAARPPSGPAVFASTGSTLLYRLQTRSGAARVCLSAARSSAWRGRRWLFSLLPHPPVDYGKSRSNNRHAKTEPWPLRCELLALQDWLVCRGDMILDLSLFLKAVIEFKKDSSMVAAASCRALPVAIKLNSSMANKLLYISISQSQLYLTS